MKTLREYIDQLDEISRRDFLKGAGATAGLAAMGAPKGVQAQEIVKWSNYARKLALDSVRVKDDQGYDLRNWISQNVSAWVSNYCEYTDSYNAKNVIDYANETALDASGFKDAGLTLFRLLNVADLKKRANDFLMTYRAAIQEKTREWEKAGKPQTYTPRSDSSQQQPTQSTVPGATPQNPQQVILKGIDDGIVDYNWYRTMSKAGYNDADIAKTIEYRRANPDAYPRNQTTPVREEEVDEAASPDAVKRIEQLVQYK
jgi:hypothetical protein